MAALEDKIAQQAVVDVILTPIYEGESFGFSYGFRAGRWLNAGVIEGGSWSDTGMGTPQEAFVSPDLANMFQHYVLDLWSHRERRPSVPDGEAIIVHYANDVRVQGELPRPLSGWSRMTTSVPSAKDLRSRGPRTSQRRG